jgi:hypothetical protein
MRQDYAEQIGFDKNHLEFKSIMSTIQTFFLLLTPREGFEEPIARESADPEAVGTLSQNGVFFPPPNTSPLESIISVFKFLCLEARGDSGGWFPTDDSQCTHPD